MGKGSVKRQGNEKRIRENHDKIFNKDKPNYNGVDEHGLELPDKEMIFTPFLNRIRCQQCRKIYNTKLTEIKECIDHDD